MDLKRYYHEIRETKKTLPSTCVIRSLETQDGGVAGVLTEVTCDVAARMIVERRAERASEKESAQFTARKRAAAEEAQKQAKLSQFRFVVADGQTMGERSK